MTSTRSATSATTPRSWVMKSIAMLCCTRRSSSRASTRACTVTSRAVVGSSAISRAGSQAMAMAIITRCFCPPDTSWG